MSLVKCATLKCKTYLKGSSDAVADASGTLLADGRFCWRCRCRRNDREPPKKRPP